MRIDEIVKLNDVLKADQYLKLLQGIKSSTGNDINITRIKNRVIQSWKKGVKSHKHYGNLLQTINLNIHDLIK